MAGKRAGQDSIRINDHYLVSQAVCLAFWTGQREVWVSLGSQTHRRFIVTVAEATDLADGSLRQINVVLNWSEELKNR